MVEITSVNEIEELMKWREEVIFNVFGIKATAELLDANRDYYLRHILDGSHKACVALFHGEEAGTGSICLSEELPSPDNPSGICAFLMNIYVRKKFRKHGIATSIVNHLVDEAKRLGCGRIYLESTEMAKHLYKRCGFIDMVNMMEYEK